MKRPVVPHARPRATPVVGAEEHQRRVEGHRREGLAGEPDRRPAVAFPVTTSPPSRSDRARGASAPASARPSRRVLRPLGLTRLAEGLDERGEPGRLTAGDATVRLLDRHDREGVAVVEVERHPGLAAHRTGCRRPRATRACGSARGCARRARRGSARRRSTRTARPARRSRRRDPRNISRSPRPHRPSTWAGMRRRSRRRRRARPTRRRGPRGALAGDGTARGRAAGPCARSRPSSARRLHSRHAAMSVTRIARAPRS